MAHHVDVPVGHGIEGADIEGDRLHGAGLAAVPSAGKATGCGPLDRGQNCRALCASTAAPAGASLPAALSNEKNAVGRSCAGSGNRVPDQPYAAPISPRAVCECLRCRPCAATPLARAVRRERPPRNRARRRGRAAALRADRAERDRAAHLCRPARRRGRGRRRGDRAPHRRRREAEHPGFAQPHAAARRHVFRPARRGPRPDPARRQRQCTRAPALRRADHRRRRRRPRDGRHPARRRRRSSCDRRPL